MNSTIENLNPVNLFCINVTIENVLNQTICLLELKKKTFKMLFLKKECPTKRKRIARTVTNTM